MNLNAVDLNLLKAFHALVTEQHVTRAAERVGLTQPAMSNALSRLRHMFRDEILVRGPDGMQATPRALALAGPIRESLDQIDRVVNRAADFDPAQASRHFTIAMNDFAALMLLPRLMPQLKTEAPGIDLRVVSPPSAQALEMLAHDEIDFAMGVFPEKPRWVAGQDVSELDFVCVACKTNPLLKDGLDLDTYLSMSHVLISLRGDPSGFVDQHLATLGLKRRIALTIPHFMVAPFVLANTNLASVLLRPMAELLAPIANIGMWPLPFEVPEMTGEIIWHNRFNTDPAHRWLRDKIIDIRMSDGAGAQAAA